MKYLGIAFLLVSLGCASMMPANTPGTVTTSKSDYDGTLQTVVAPSWTGDVGQIKIGAFKTSKMAKEDVVLVVQNDAIKYFDNNHPNFFVKIDGVEIPLSPDNKNTECHTSNTITYAYCQQQFSVKVDFIEKMLKAKSVKFKLNLRDNTYATGNLDKTGWTTAKTALIDFLKEIDKKGMSSRATASQK